MAPISENKFLPFKIIAETKIILIKVKTKKKQYKTV
jgi:hypothetical protein